jgi:hypothetical protein
MTDGSWKDRREREDGQRKTWGDVQAITQYASTGNARREEVTTQISIAAKNASDCLVGAFFCVRTSTGKRSKSGHQSWIRMRRWGPDDLPFLAKMFHAVGLYRKVKVEKNETQSNESTKANGTLIACS